MELVIHDVTGVVTPAFIQYLCGVIYSQLRRKTTYKFKTKWNNYLQSSTSYPEFKTIQVENVVYQAAKSIKFTQDNDIFTFSIDKYKKIGKSKTSLYTVCGLLNYGNLEICGDHIFSQVFTEISNNIERYYDLFVIINRAAQQGNS